MTLVSQLQTLIGITWDNKGFNKKLNTFKKGGLLNNATFSGNNRKIMTDIVNYLYKNNKLSLNQYKNLVNYQLGDYFYCDLDSKATFNSFNYIYNNIIVEDKSFILTARIPDIGEDDDIPRTSRNLVTDLLIYTDSTPYLNWLYGKIQFDKSYITRNNFFVFTRSVKEVKINSVNWIIKTFMTDEKKSNYINMHTKENKKYLMKLNKDLISNMKETYFYDPTDSDNEYQRNVFKMSHILTTKFKLDKKEIISSMKEEPHNGGLKEYINCIFNF